MVLSQLFVNCAVTQLLFNSAVAAIVNCAGTCFLAALYSLTFVNYAITDFASYRIKDNLLVNVVIMELR